MFLSFVPTKNAKIDAKHSILGNKKTLKEKCIMSVLYFKRTTKQKTQILVYIERFPRFQNAIYMGIQNKLIENVSSRVLRRKTLKRMETNQYQEIEKHYQKGIF